MAVAENELNPIPADVLGSSNTEIVWNHSWIYDALAGYLANAASAHTF